MTQKKSIESTLAKRFGGKVVGPATSVAQAEVPQDQPAEAQETTSQLAGNVETSNKP